MIKRLQRLKKLLRKLQDGTDVQARDLQSALTEEEWEHYQDAWKHEKISRTEQPPEKLQEYIQRRQEVALASARTLRYQNRPATTRKGVTSEKMGNLADTKLSELLDWLREWLAADPSLIMWLVHQEPHKSVEEMIDAGEAPQVCTSRTVKGGRHSPMGKMNKRQLKIRTIEDAIFALEGTSNPAEVAVTLIVKPSKSKRDFSGFKV